MNSNLGSPYDISVESADFARTQVPASKETQELLAKSEFYEAPVLIARHLDRVVGMMSVDGDLFVFKDDELIVEQLKAAFFRLSKITVKFFPVDR
jgi:hypothetical protein